MDKCPQCGDTCTCKLEPKKAKKVSKEALVDAIKAKTRLIESKQIVRK